MNFSVGGSGLSSLFDPRPVPGCAQARVQVRERFSRLREERRALVSQLRSLTDAGDFDGALAASTALRASINGETMTVFRYQDWILRQLLEPLQYARAHCAALPFLPDWLHVGALLLADRDRRMDPDAV